VKANGGWRLLVVDGDGTVVGSFDRSRLEETHRWAHARVQEPGTVLPVRIEDLRLRLTWTVDRRSCRMTTWAVLPEESGVRLGCPLVQVRRVGSVVRRMAWERR
jgi:hypothetical protein